MAKCNYCEKNMEDNATISCDYNQAKIDGKIYERNYWHHDIGNRCHDCNIVNGNYHHFGCDMEECPKCKMQFAFCGCIKKNLINKK